MYHSHRTSSVSNSYLQTRVDPYTSDDVSASGEAPATSRPPAVFAPADLYTPSERASAGSPRVPSAPGGASPRVAVSDAITLMNTTGKEQYDRDARPQKRSLSIQVINPTEMSSSSNFGAMAAFGPCVSRSLGSTMRPPQQSVSDKEPRAKGKATRPAEGSTSKSLDVIPPKRRHTATVSAEGKAAPSSSDTSARPDVPGGDAGQQPARQESSAGDQPPVLDFFSAVEEHNAKEAVGPLAASAKLLRETKYVAQSAYTQHNPFRVQTFADFAAHPLFDPPSHFKKYPEAVGQSSMGVGASHENGRAMLGEYLVHRLVDSTHPMSQRERNEMIDVLNDTLATLQTGDWFFKWTRTNRVHRRFFWLNMQRGTLMWSRSLRQSLVWNSELKVADVTSIKPDCIRDATTGRSFYRMFIATADRGLCLATELPEKFDCWFKAIQQLTLPNLSSGVPGLWGRPTSVLNNGRKGALGRWASRCSALQAIADGTAGYSGNLEIQPVGRVSSSD